MKEKATIYDYVRICEYYKDCIQCPLGGRVGYTCSVKPLNMDAGKVNKIVLEWCKEHPVKTRQDKFLEMFPNTMKDEDVINIDPCVVDETLHLASPCWECAKKSNVEDCEECRRKYWFAEAKE